MVTKKTIDTEIELLKLQHQNMQSDLTEIKTDLKSNHKEVLEKIDWLDTKFATKAEHKENSNKINWVIWVLITIWSSIWLWVLSKILNLI